MKNMGISKVYEERQTISQLVRNNEDKLRRKGVDIRKVKYTSTPAFRHKNQLYTVKSYTYNNFINNHLKKINESDLTVFFLVDKSDEYHFEVDTDIVRFLIINDETNIKFPTIEEYTKNNN